MAQSTCMKCGGTDFELKDITPEKGGHRYRAVQCAHCGGVIGLVEYEHTGGFLRSIERQVVALEKRLKDISRKLEG